MNGLHTLAVVAPLMALGFWLQLRDWGTPRVYFGRRPSLADCVLPQPQRLEVRRD
jgi:hypothetical protein